MSWPVLQQRIIPQLAARAAAQGVLETRLYRRLGLQQALHLSRIVGPRHESPLCPFPVAAKSWAVLSGGNFKPIIRRQLRIYRVRRVDGLHAGADLYRVFRARDESLQAHRGNDKGPGGPDGGRKFHGCIEDNKEGLLGSVVPRREK